MKSRSAARLPLITPATVLLCVRDNPGLSHEDLLGRFGLNPVFTTSQWTENNRVESTLRSLAQCGLIEARADNRWHCTRLVRKLQKSLEFSLTELAARSEASQSDAARQIRALLQPKFQESIPPHFRDDFFRTLKEIRDCHVIGCHIAAISLCGKILEIALKMILERNAVNYDAADTIGQLLRRVREQLPLHYLDPSLGNICNIINQARIPAIHAKANVPIPSEAQAAMVIHAMRDVVHRVLADTEAFDLE